MPPKEIGWAVAIIFTVALPCDEEGRGFFTFAHYIAAALQLDGAAPVLCKGRCHRHDRYSTYHIRQHDELRPLAHQLLRQFVHGQIKVLTAMDQPPPVPGIWRSSAARSSLASAKDSSVTNVSSKAIAFFMMFSPLLGFNRSVCSHKVLSRKGGRQWSCPQSVKLLPCFPCSGLNPDPFLSIIRI